MFLGAGTRPGGPSPHARDKPTSGVTCDQAATPKTNCGLGVQEQPTLSRAATGGVRVCDAFRLGDVAGALVQGNGGRVTRLSGLAVYTGDGRRCSDYPGELLAVINPLRKSTMAPGGQSETSRLNGYHGSTRYCRPGVAGDWPTGAMGICGLHADHPAGGVGPGPAFTMGTITTINNVADAPAYAWPNSTSV